MLILRFFRRSLPLTSLLVLAAACGGSVNGDPFSNTGGGGASSTSTTGTATTGTTATGTAGATTTTATGATGTGTTTAATTSTTTTGGGQTGSAFTAVPLSTCGAGVYTAAATIGSQTFQMQLDTGSTSVGVASSACSACKVAPEYTPGSSAVDQHKTAQIKYGTGSWSGEIYQDSVSLGAETAPVKLVSITSQSDFFDSFECSTVQGILGFGPSGAALAGTNAVYDQLVSTDHLPDVFATELCDSGGTLWLGGYDATATTAAPQYVPMATNAQVQQYYAVGLTSMAVNGTTVAIATTKYPDSAVDTGTSVMVLQTTAYNALTAAIQSNAAFKQAFGTTFFSGSTSDVACGTTTQTKAQLDAALPPMTMTFGNVTFRAAATDSYLVQDQGQWCSSLYADAAVATSLRLASIIGSPLLRSTVVVFDRAQNRVGFAPHTACP